jgi:hypothetical protein
MCIRDRIIKRVTQIPGARSFWRRFPFGPLDVRVKYGISARPSYAYGVYAAADLARKLRLPGISVLELGVAGGRGLLALEEISAEISRQMGVQISVHGFDSGSGMPSPVDYRDLPHIWEQGFYRMDEGSLRATLHDAKLHIGPVADTIPEFLREGAFPPIGFVSFDLDYYSSTKQSFRLFEGAEATRLPRVFCYFDDIMWPEAACHNPYVGELCAIREFNLENDGRKAITPINMLRHMMGYEAPWHEQLYVAHDFAHPLYCKNITPAGVEHTQKPL